MGITKIEILIILTVSIALFSLSLAVLQWNIEKKEEKNNFPRKENGYVCKNTLKRSNARVQAEKGEK